VVLVLVSPLLFHPLLTLPLEAKLALVTISTTIVTMKPNGLRFRLGMGLLTWFLLTRLLILLLFPNKLISLVTLELDGFFGNHLWSEGIWEDLEMCQVCFLVGWA
jgi:hypothetical protein